MYRFEKINGAQASRLRHARRAILAEAQAEGGIPVLNSAVKRNGWVEDGCTVRYFNLGGGVYGLRLRTKGEIPPRVRRLVSAAGITL